MSLSLVFAGSASLQTPTTITHNWLVAPASNNDRASLMSDAIKLHSVSKQGRCEISVLAAVATYRI